MQNFRAYVCFKLTKVVVLIADDHGSRRSILTFCATVGFLLVTNIIFAPPAYKLLGSWFKAPASCVCFFVICYLANCFQSAFPWDSADYIEFFMLELNCISNRAKNKRWLFICQPLFPRFFSWTSRFIFCRSAFVCSPNFCCLPKKLSLLGNLEDPF